MIQANKYTRSLLYIVISITIFALSGAHASLAENSIPVKNIRHLYDIRGTQKSPLSLPSDVAVDREGNIYIVDSGNNRVSVFNSAGQHISYISKSGSNKEEIYNPVGIDVDDNNIYVADKGNHRIQIFGREGGHKKSVVVRENGVLIRPVDVKADAAANALFITGNNNHKIMVSNHLEKIIHTWGGEGTSQGEMRYPATLASHRNNIYVVDVLNSRIQIFNKKGKLQAVAGQWGVLPGQLFRPKGVSVDDNGNIYVSDSYMGVIQVFSDDTTFRYALATEGRLHKFTSPAGLVVDKKNRLYVCEMLANKVSVFALGP